MIRRWLLALIREAVSTEVEHHFRSLEDKTSLIESHFANIAVRVKEKQEAAKPTRARTWQELKERLEAEPKG